MYRVGALCLSLFNLGGYPQQLTSAVRSLSKAASQGGPSEVCVAGVLLAQAETSKGNIRSRNAQKWEQVLRSAWKCWPAGFLILDMLKFHFWLAMNQILFFLKACYV